MPFLAELTSWLAADAPVLIAEFGQSTVPLGELSSQRGRAGRYTAEVTAGSREQDVVTTTTQGSQGCIRVTSTLDEPGGPQGCPRQRGRIDMGHRPNKCRWRRLCPVPDLRVGRSKITPPVASPTVQVVAADRLYGAPSTGHSGGVAFVGSSAVALMVGIYSADSTAARPSPSSASTSGTPRTLWPCQTGRRLRRPRVHAHPAQLRDVTINQSSKSAGSRWSGGTGRVPRPRLGCRLAPSRVARLALAR